MKGTLGLASDFDLTHVKAPRPHTARSLRTPLGRLLFTKDKGDSRLFGSDQLLSNLTIVHRDGDGEIKEVRDTGSGLVTNAGVNLMAYDYGWAAGATLKQMNYHALGTGSTAAASSDVFLQTANGATSLSGTTNGYVTGTQSLQPNSASSPYSPVYQTVATFTFTGTVAVTEWILANANGTNFTGTATATSSSSLTNSGATFTTAGNGLQGWTVEAGTTTPINTTPTTTPMGQVKSNTGTALTLLNPTPTWLSLTNQAVATPSGTASYVVFPTAFDHKVFGTVTANSGDTIQITYSLSLNSGG